MASIDKEVPYEMINPFGTSYMRAVYKLGYDGMMGGSFWKDRPSFSDATADTPQAPAR